MKTLMAVTFFILTSSTYGQTLVVDKITCAEKNRSDYGLYKKQGGIIESTELIEKAIGDFPEIASKLFVKLLVSDEKFKVTQIEAFYTFAEGRASMHDSRTQSCGFSYQATLKYPSGIEAVVKGGSERVNQECPAVEEKK